VPESLRHMLLEAALVCPDAVVQTCSAQREIQPIHRRAAADQQRSRWKHAPMHAHMSV
jgi:hypothetical protein